MLAAIFNINSENWTINSLLSGEVVSRDSDVEIEDDANEEEDEFEEDDEEENESEAKNTPDENSDIFRKDEENLTISECF